MVSVFVPKTPPYNYMEEDDDELDAPFNYKMENHVKCPYKPYKCPYTSYGNKLDIHYAYEYDREITDIFQDMEKCTDEGIILLRKDVGSYFITVLYYVKRYDSYFVNRVFFDKLNEFKEELTRLAYEKEVMHYSGMSYTRFTDAYFEYCRR